MATYMAFLVKAVAVYLKNYQFTAFERTCELLDFFGCPMCEGIAQWPTSKLANAMRGSNMPEPSDQGAIATRFSGRAVTSMRWAVTW